MEPNLSLPCVCITKSFSIHKDHKAADGNADDDNNDKVPTINDNTALIGNRTGSQILCSLSN